MGAETLAFESELKAYTAARNVVSVNSCTSALYLALLVSGVRKGDEVICPSLTWCSTANAALYLGARPVFCDVDAGTLCISPETVRAKLTPRTRAVIVVHFGGLAVDVRALRRALPKRVAIIEDAAHALGSTYPDGSPWVPRETSCASASIPTRTWPRPRVGRSRWPMRSIADRLRSLRQHGLPVSAWKRFTNPRSLLQSAKLVELGYKMNFTDLQACIARVQLSRQPELDARRRAIARLYSRRLSGLRTPLTFQDEACSPGHARHLFVIQLPVGSSRSARDKLVLALRKRKIGATIHYFPLHRMPLYGRRGRAPCR